ncbi:MAG: Dipeptide transport ATP-binding protein DppD [Chlamydiia bacterium]|nr:Dipeptide transport ATP-binding protein DppD [Chlamydiia bacterium]MCH9618919.1 Dipeptide transport ATP-binding protein DppD [Chlamydiia bacterium]MCH9624632.1 Dipeptide transport ATP-binding protein DppD [Chlamydiia bacterium]
MDKNQYSSRPILEIQNFTYSFSKGITPPEVKNVSFDLYPNEFIGIIGESGSGKSVTAKAILQLNSSKGKADAKSKIIYGGENLLTLKEESIRRIRGRDIAIVFQDPMIYLNPTATIGAQIEESLHLHFPHYNSKELYNKTLDLLQTVELTDRESLYSRYPHELSGGMRQRVMIAIALAPNPRIFIADEITTALDVTVQHEILILLKHLQKTLAMSVIFITHDLSIIAKFASRVVVMYQGQVMEKGLTNDVCFSPMHPYTEALIGAIPKMSMDKNSRLKSIEVLRENDRGGCIFYNKCSNAKKECKKNIPKKIDIKDHSVLCHFPLNQKKEEVLCTTKTLFSK